MSQWVRLWEDMPNDPKWRLVARRARVTDASHCVTVCDVVTVFVHMLICAGTGENRGTLDGWDDEVVAAAIDAEPELVTVIRAAMEGLILDGNRLRSWEKRQPNREDSSAVRMSALRAKRDAMKRSVTQCDALVTQRDAPEEKRIDSDLKNKKPLVFSKKEKSGKNSIEKEKTEIAADARLSLADSDFAGGEGMGLDRTVSEWVKFRDHHLKIGSMLADWGAAWRGWVRKSLELSGKPNGHTAPSEAAAKLVFTEEGTPQWNAWETSWRKTHGTSLPRRYGTNGKAHWHLPTEWPPTEP
jgi:hypothetical protein